MSAAEKLTDLSPAEKARVHQALRDERIISDECQCVVCRSDCAGIVSCALEDDDV